MAVAKATRAEPGPPQVARCSTTASALAARRQAGGGGASLLDSTLETSAAVEGASLRSATVRSSERVGPQAGDARVAARTMRSALEKGASWPLEKTAVE